MIFNTVWKNNQVSGGGADVSVVTALAEHILQNKIIVDSNGNPISGTMPDNGSGGGTISTVAQSIDIPKGYYDGNGFVSISPEEQIKIIPTNIRANETVLGVTGTLIEGPVGVSGSFVPTSNTQTVTISGLGFRPKAVLVTHNDLGIDYAVDSNYMFSIGWFLFDTSFIQGDVDDELLYSYAYYNSSSGLATANRNMFQATVSDDGFVLSKKSYTGARFKSGVTYYYLAFK